MEVVATLVTRFAQTFILQRYDSNDPEVMWFLTVMLMCILNLSWSDIVVRRMQPSHHSSPVRLCSSASSFCTCTVLYSFVLIVVPQHVSTRRHILEEVVLPHVCR